MLTSFINVRSIGFFFFKFFLKRAFWYFSALLVLYHVRECEIVDYTIVACTVSILEWSERERKIFVFYSIATFYDRFIASVWYFATCS